MEKKMSNIRPLDIKKVDTKEFELPETLFVSDIDTKIFQGIVLETISTIDGIALAQGSFINNILGRSGPEIGSGIQSERDNRDHSVSIKIEVDIRYGISIPEKAEEIQSKVVEEITRLTGLRVSAVHVFFKNIIPLDQANSTLKALQQQLSKQMHAQGESEEYSDDF